MEVDASDLRYEPTEAEFQRQVIELAKRLGWRVAFFRKVRVQRANGKTYYETPVGADGKGWPDLFLVRGEQTPIAAELKVGKNRPSKEQIAWLDAMREAGIDAAVWTPGQWDSIVRRLR